MLIESIIEALAGAVSVYVGIRWISKRKIPIVHEGNDKPIGWLRGYAAAIAGGVLSCFGLYMLAVAFGFAPLIWRE